MSDLTQSEQNEEESDVLDAFPEELLRLMGKMNSISSELSNDIKRVEIKLESLRFALAFISQNYVKKNENDVEFKKSYDDLRVAFLQKMTKAGFDASQREFAMHNLASALQQFDD